MAGFGRSPESVEFKNIIQNTEMKITKTKEIRERMKLLEDLSLAEMSSKDRYYYYHDYYHYHYHYYYD